MISVECAEGKYRSSSMTECESCSLGKEPNDAKDDCGKYSFQIFFTCILIFKFFRPNFTNRAWHLIWVVLTNVIWIIIVCFSEIYKAEKIT